MKKMPRLNLRISHPAVQGTLAILVCVALVGSGYVFGYKRGQSGYPSPIAPGFFSNTSNNRTSSATSSTVDFGLFWQAWNAVDDNFYGDLTPSKRLDGAISGMVAGLGDPFTVYLPPAENKIFNSTLQGNFGGIGAELTQKDGYVTVVAPLDGMPAAAAGLKAQDIITEVDGKKTADTNLDDVINEIRGPEGSKVTLTVVRSGVEQPLKIAITRSTITLKSVKWHLIGADKNIMYIQMTEFGDDTTSLLQQALEEAKKDNAKGLVIDLRNNPGGYLEEAAKEIGFLIPQAPTNDNAELKKRVAVLEHFRDGSQKEDLAPTQPILDQTPIAILINGGSASASEIFSGALRDYKRATLIGTKSFGKGSAQTLVSLANGGAVKVTIAKWFTPLGVGIDGKGLQPDTVIDLPQDASPTDSDVQVSKALEVLGSK